MQLLVLRYWALLWLCDMKSFQSWGHIPVVQQTILKPVWRNISIPELDQTTLLPFGLGRSYGDSCLNNGGTLCVTSNLNHFISFDNVNGLLRCEAGVSLDEILKLVVPHGWFLPVTPGTKYVTVGGAIANDVHGKNHHVTGTFGCHVTQFELLRSDGSRLICSPENNPELFAATISGLGLTGLITWAEISLKKINSSFIDSETIRFSNINEFFELSNESDDDWEYTVSWIDCLAKGKDLGRGLFMCGRHADQTHELSTHKLAKLVIPFAMPQFLLNSYSITAFNNIYYRKNSNKKRKQLVHYDPFFYPLDSISRWNNMYGKRGFYQYQCVVPIDDGVEITRKLLQTISDSKQGSFLSVLKKFGNIKSPGMLSFPREGITLALDFPNHGTDTLTLMEKLDKIVVAAGGAVYPAKDARMSAASFQQYYPQWHEFSKYIDPGFSSSFWRRVTAKQDSNC